MPEEYRSPIVVVLGHIDHGKTSLLDRIRQTRVADGEAGGITQSIGSTFVPMTLITRLCRKMFEKLGISPTLSGLLFIDTPGHEAFSSMRQRGSRIADLAILIVDINEGFMPQTTESLQILIQTKTPFIVAFNKIDKIYGWVSDSDIFLENYGKQSPSVTDSFEKRFYDVTGQLYSNGIKADRFDRIQDFSKEVAIVPVSARTGEGVSELLFVLTGLAEKYLKQSLIKTEDCKGVILEVKEMKGLGNTIDTIIYDGRISKGDYVVISGKEPIITKVKGLLVPRALQDMRAEKKFDYIDHADASSGVKIFASGLSEAVAGSDFRAVKTESEANMLKKEMVVQEDAGLVEEEGLMLKADTLGGLEALRIIFKDFSIKMAEVGQVTKNDVINAEINRDPFYKAVIGFNVKATEEAESMAKTRGIRIITSPVIYHLLEEYRKWKEQKQMEIEMEKMKDVTLPAKFTVLPGCIFRASKPAVVGCEIVSGVIKPGFGVFRVDEYENKPVSLGRIKEIQSEGISVDQAKAGEKVAISITEAIFQKNFNEGDMIYTDLGQKDYELLRQFEKILSPDQKQALEEIKNIKGFW